MVVTELTALLTAVGGLQKLVESSAEAISGIRGFRGAKQAAEAAGKQLEQVRSDLSSVGKLARLAESYLRMHSELVLLRDSTEHAQHTVAENRRTLENVGSPTRRAMWESVSGLNGVIVQHATVVRSIVRGEEEYFDQEGKGAIESEMQDVDRRLTRIDELIRSENAPDLERELANATTTIRNTSERAEGTLEKILDTLRRVGMD